MAFRLLRSRPTAISHNTSPFGEIRAAFAIPKQRKGAVINSFLKHTRNEPAGLALRRMILQLDT